MMWTCSHMWFHPKNTRGIFKCTCHMNFHVNFARRNFLKTACFEIWRVSRQVSCQKRLVCNRGCTNGFTRKNFPILTLKIDFVWFWFSNGFPQRGFLQTSVSKMFNLFFLQRFLNNNLSRWIQHRTLFSITFSFWHMFYLNKVKVFSQQGVLKINRVSEFIFNKWLVQGGALEICHQIIRYQTPLLSTNIWLKLFCAKKMTMCVHVFSGKSHENCLNFLISESWTNFSTKASL